VLARIAGSRWSLVVTVAVFLTGPLFGWSGEWWIWIDRACYLVTLWIALGVQSSQNHDTKAMQVKLDEIIRLLPGSNRAVDIERLADRDIDALKKT
jgi:low affinity Fe/Cu permease